MTSDPLGQVIQLTQSLVRFQSVHDRPQDIHRCAGVVEAYLHRSGAEVQRIDYEDTPSLLILPRDRFAPVLLMSHIDVVAAEPQQFEPFVRDGKLYGRGSLDDKYAVALSLVLLKEHLERLREQGKGQQELPFGLLITSDEEMGGFHGAGHVLKTLDTDFVIVLDGGSPDEIIVKQKGFVKLRLVAEGRTAHGSQPWLGENAIEKLIDDHRQLGAMFAPSSPDHWHSTLNLSMLHSGRPGETESFNQVSDHAEAVLDIRYTEEDDADALIDHLRKRLRSEVHVEASGPVFEGGDSPYLDLLLEIAQDANLGFTHSAGDARFLTEYGIPGVVWGAEGEESAHAAHEHVNLESVRRLYGMLDEFLRAI